MKENIIFKNRGNSAKIRRGKNIFKTNLNKSKNQYPSILINSYIQETTPPVIYTLPNSRKMSSGMGNNIEREQLYENNMLLRKSLNNLEKQLAKSKYMNVKNELEIKKKEKIILDFYKENSRENKDESKINTAKESALLILFKKKYDKLKSDYEKECNENKILKANVNLTQIKEFQIQNDIYIKEIKKLKKLYENSQKYHSKYKQNLNKLKEIKDKFFEQHTIIMNYEKKIQLLNEEMTKLKEENNSIKIYLDKIIRVKNKLNLNNKLLTLRNKKLLETKKLAEEIELDQNSYKKENEDQKKEISDLKSALNIRIADIKSLQEENEKYKISLGKIDKTAIEPINYNSLKYYEKKTVPENIDRIELYKSLYEENLIIISYYEQFMKENDINPKNILKKYGYSGIINTNNKVLYNINNKLEEKKLNEENNNNINNNIKNNYDNNTDAGLSDINTKALTNTYQNINNNDIKTEKSLENKEIEEINFFFSLFIKNLESKKITTEIMKSKIDKIKESISKKNKISDKEFITPFLNMFIETMKIKKESDKSYIEKFLATYMNYLKNNRNDFIQGLNNAFDNIIDYTSLDNIDYLLNSLAFNLQKYKNILITKIKEVDKGNTNLILFQDFNKILSDIGDPIRIELIEFLLFKMKENTDENCSIFDFNYKIVLDLLEKKIPDDFEDNDMGNIISEKLSEFKNNMILDNTNLEKVCQDKIQKFVLNNKNYEVIEKDTFFNIMEKYKVSVDEQIKENIYTLFIVTEPKCTNNGKVKMMNFMKLNNLFLNDYYDEEENN